MKNLFGQRPAPRSVASVVSATATPQGRTTPTDKVPSPVQSQSNYPTRTFTAITSPGAVKTVYTAAVEWSRIKMKLETAGQVAYSTSQQFVLTGGDGILLDPDDWVEFELAKGNNLYLLSSTANRVKVIVQPIPWAEQVLGGIVRGVTGVVQAVGGVQSAVAALADRMFRK